MTDRDLDFANDIRRATEDRQSRWPWMLLLALLAMMAGFVWWASISKLEQGATGIGKVIPSSQTQLVENLEAGIVQEILVREGDRVEPGQMLVRMESTGESARLSELEKRETELRAELARLNLETELVPEFSIDNSDGRFAETILAEQRAIFAAGRRRLEENLQIKRLQNEQKQQALAEARANIAKQEQALELAAREEELTRRLFRRKAVPELEFIRVQRSTQELRSNLEIIKASLGRIEAEIRETEAQIRAEETNYVITALERLSLVNSDLTAVVERSKEAREKLRQTGLASPVGGIINQLNVATVGEVILPGTTVAEITPIDDRLLIEARIRPQDIAFISPGQPAMVRLSAYDYTKYGSLRGKVERIGVDTVVDEENNSFFRVIIATDEAPSHSDEIRIMPGMVATVNILTGERTVLELLLKPVIRVRDEAFRS